MAEEQANEKGYENFLKTSGYSATTINNYTTYYRLFESLFESKEISQEGIDYFCREHNNHVARAFLKSCLEYLGYIEYKIRQPKGRPKERIPRWITRKQYVQLVNDLEMREDVKILIRILYESGLRICEVVGDRFHKPLTSSNIDFETNEIRGIGKFNKEFIVYIKPKTAWLIKNMIKTYELQPNQSLFTFQERRAQVLIKKEGFRILGKDIHPHMFRHGLATYLLRKGYSLPEIKIILRHSNLNTVERYTHLERKDLKEKLKQDGYGT